ncbi:MAG TPA: nucleotide exchange factor GrpE, partial [Pedobacter sp.]
MFSKKKKTINEDLPVEENANEQVNTQNEQLNAETEENTLIPEQEIVPELSLEEKLQQENAALNDKYLRLFADFDNYKRRTQKERVELLQTAGKDVIVSLLSVLDDFDRANKAMEGTTDVAAVREGINLVHIKLKNLLAQKGLKEMESINTVFNTDNHEA